MRAKILPTALFAALTLTAITSVRAEEATFEVTWLGKNNMSWTDSEVWDSATPEAWQTAIINYSSLIKFKAGNGETVVSNVVVGANVAPTFQRADSAATGQHLLVQEMNGDGTLKLNRVGIHADYSNYDTCNISVAKIEAVANGNNDSWFDGGSASGKRMVVNSDITVNGFLKVYKQTTLAGETTLAGKLQMVDEAVVVNNLVYAGDDATIDSDSKGSVGRLTIRSGILSPSALPTGVTVGSLVLDGGTLSVASDFSGTIAVAEGGGTLFLEGEWTDADLVSLPAGLSFAEGADLSKVTVQATVGKSSSPAMFAIAHENETYSLEYVGYPFHLEELDLSWMTSGWEHPVTNKSIYSISDGSYTSLRLWNGSDWQSYSKGISVQAESHLIIKLGGNGSAFSAVVGLDRSADGDGRCGSKVVKFAVRDVVGGTNLVESAWLGTKTAAQTITADLSGIDFIDLVVYPDPNNGGSWQHCDWVNPTIVMKGDAAPVTRSADGTNHWTGMGENDNWVTAANWEFGVPREDATAVFDSSVTVLVGNTGEGGSLPETVAVSNMLVNAGAVVTVRPVAPEFWDAPRIILQEMNGEGKVQLAKTGIEAAYTGDRAECLINVAEIEALKTTRWNNDIWSWLNGGNSDGKKMVVKSKVTGNGWLSFDGNVQVDGKVYVTHKLTLSENTNKPEYFFTSEAFSFADKGNEEASKNKGSVGCIYIKGGVFTPSAYEGLFTSYVLDGGTLNVADVASSVPVLSGGFLRWTVVDAFGDSAPEWPEGLSLNFVDGSSATLADVYAVVTDATGAQRTYSISESGGVYSLGEAQPSGSRVVWIGGGSDNKWENGANWQFGAVPTADQTAVFRGHPTVYVRESAYNEETYHQEISAVEIEEGSSLTIKPVDIYYPPMSLYAGRVSGGGRLRLWNVGLAAYGDADTVCDVTVPTVELVREIRYLDSQGNHDYPGARLNGGDAKGLRIFSKIEGDVNLTVQNRVIFAGDNSGVTGFVDMSSGSGWGQPERYFDSVDSLFPNAIGFKSRGRLFFNFTSGTAKLGTVDFGESYGASLVMKNGANVTLEVAGGIINDSHNGDGFEVWTRAEGADDYLRVTGFDTGSGYTKGCAGLTIKKVGDGTLVYGLTKAHNLVVAEGRVEFTGENSGGDDADVNVTVKAGASIGTPEAFSHENPNWTLGGDVTVRHQFTFEPGAAIKQEYIATTTTDEQTQEETTTYSMRKLTIADDVDLANVVFGVTNPEDLPAVTKAAVAGLPRFTMFAANSLSGAVATENGGYTPEGSEKNCKWLFRTKRNSVNEVEFYPFQKLGFAVIVR